MYTWGYLKNSILAKLDLDQDEATEMKLLNRFATYANEAMTQICSSVKPNRTYYEVRFYKTISHWNNLLYLDGKVIAGTIIDDVVYDANGDVFAYPVGRFISMPKDFISFGDGRTWRLIGNESLICHDNVIIREGYNKFTCLEYGFYKISYNARWYDFSNVVDDDILSNVPVDVLECIPSYVAHQCYKIDDEYKSAVFRNEYEMFLARIDNSDYDNTTTITIEGDW